MKNHRRLGIAQFLGGMNNLITKADGNEATYGFVAADTVTAKAIRDGLEENEAAKTAKRAELKALTTQGKNLRSQGNDFISLLKTTATSKKIPLATQQEIGFGDDDKIPSKIPVYDPADLVVTGASNGINTLKWNKNDNKAGTIYNIEALIGEATDFIIVGTTTVTRFEHKNQKPGNEITYRIRAQRGDDFSDYSNEATVYGNK